MKRGEATLGQGQRLVRLQDSFTDLATVTTSSSSGGFTGWPGRGVSRTTIACNVFRFLHLSRTVPTYFVRQEDESSFWVLSGVKMWQEAVVVQRGHHGGKSSLLLSEIRNTSTAQDRGVAPTARMEALAKRVFLHLEEGWKALGVQLLELEVNLGETLEGRLVVGGIFDNESWHIRQDSDRLDGRCLQAELLAGRTPTESECLRAQKNTTHVVARSSRLLDALCSSQQTPIGPLVGVIMGSQSDWPTMKEATNILDKLGIPYEAKIVSAHRTPTRLFAYARSAESRGIRVIIAGAGGAAHLPGMAASMTTLPVFGVPIKTSTLNGLDSLLSIVQMPKGIPVGTLAIGESGAVNAALLTAAVLSGHGSYPDIAAALRQFRDDQTNSVAEEPEQLQRPHMADALSTVGDIRTAIPPGSVIGIIGGGQLAKMIAIAGAYLGYRSHIYCPDKLSPAFQVADRVTVAEYSDTNALDLFAGEVDVITYEFENVPSACVKHLAQWRPVRPSQTILEVSQHRFREKSFLNSIGVRTARFYAVNDQQGLLQALDAIGYPAVLKTCQGGYDGKGQLKLQRPDDIEKAGELLNGHEAILEEFVPFEKEISVIVARGFAGEETTIFPIAENEHENHILKTTIVPARVSPAVQRQADDIARRIAISLDLIGVLCVEMFVVRKEKLTRWDAASAGPEEELVLVNELAPRPHNSGHWTIEGCTTSQFEQLVRAICGLPLGSTTMPRQQTLQKVVMTNLIGDEINEAQSLLHQPDTHVHIYGKHEARPGRKMGHATHLEYSGV